MQELQEFRKFTALDKRITIVEEVEKENSNPNLDTAEISKELKHKNNRWEDVREGLKREDNLVSGQS